MIAKRLGEAPQSVHGSYELKGLGSRDRAEVAVAYDQVLIEASALAQMLGRPNVVVVDCRFALGDPNAGRRAYALEHIPGAHFLDLNRDLSSSAQKHGGRHPLPLVASLVARLREIGISGGSTVIAYDDSRMAFAARAWWLLRYLGHDDVRVLDGGWAGWKAAGYEVTDAQPSVTARGTFDARPDDRWVVDRRGLLALEASARRALPLVDARETVRYLGDDEPIDPVAGHIPGAVCAPWQQFTSPDGRAIAEEDNRARWLWLAPDASPVVYCGSGVTACVDLLSLHAAGHAGARLYPGSWSDWCSYADAPIAVGPEPAGAGQG